MPVAPPLFLPLHLHSYNHQLAATCTLKGENKYNFGKGGNAALSTMNFSAPSEIFNELQIKNIWIVINAEKAVIWGHFFFLFCISSS